MDEKTKELARLAGFIVGVSDNADRQIEQFATLIRQDEREARAKVCEEWGVYEAMECAAAIRERMK